MRTVKSDRLRIVEMWVGVIMVLHRVCVVAALLLMSVEQVSVLKTEGKVETVMEKMVERVVEHYLKGCHLVFLTTTTHSPLASSIIRRLGVGGVVRDMTVDSEQHVWGDIRTTCRAVILITHHNHNNTNMALSLLERIGLYKRSEVVVVAVGLREDVKRVLLHPSLRNTAHALYLAFTPNTTPFTILTSSSISTSAPTPHTTSQSTGWKTDGGGVSVYRRCLYCNNGQAAVQLVGSWTSDNTLNPQHQFFKDQFLNFQGYVLRVVTVSYFPFVDYIRAKEEPGTPVTLTDSVDMRLLHTFTRKLNFTYTIHEEPQRTWGAEKDGVFGGMMGQLQREESDMCTASGTTPNRFKVIDYARIYPSDIMTVTSLQPSLLPQYLALVTPFSDGVWLSLLVGVVGWSVAMWALQLVWTKMVAEGGRGISFSMALMYGWGALLEQTHPDPSLSVSGQLLVGWWLVFCVVITTGYRSSLVAHLTVQGKTAPIDTLEDMVALQGWRWGTEESLYKGAVVEYFTKHQDPVVQKTHSVLEVLGWEEGLRKVQEGDYSFLAFRDFIRFIVGSRYTDANGRSPFFISKKGISVLPFLGWWFRDGAPLYHRFKELLNRLESAGVRGYWTEQVLEKRIKESREAILRDSQDSRPRLILGDERHETLKLGHMQGAFYLLCLGLAVAFHVLILELIVPPPQTPTASL
ncbi:hypothetical protein Pcinc_029638 [Petrolisthes cinctipes]|uniref:Ionotropic glutamate receptor L-glutamate and glycine-binding domain-containing protein n=1 Tax=Petrolisthes cinctipes TaxID=88211 RepID=A0AAE1K5F7_PETCI|nr:hypothetical protein Pcinc_029638 [Petrolisthes cinctipes]